MEVFSLLKIWRKSGATDSSSGDAFSDADFSSSSSYDLANQMDDEFDDDDSFFDLDFSSPDRYTIKINDDNDDMKSSNFMESPTDVFYKSNSFPKQSNSKPQSPISILKSSPKLRVFMLGFSKPKLVKSQITSASIAANDSNQLNSSKRFTIDCQIEEVVPVNSLLTRDNSLRSKLITEKLDDRSSIDVSNSPSKSNNKYRNLIKPLSVITSKRYTDKSRFSEQSPTVTPSSSPSTVLAQSPRIKKTVLKNLGKSRSDSRLLYPSSKKRDDSELQQQDGIQGAILHCKLSYNSSGRSILSRSESAPVNTMSQ